MTEIQELVTHAKKRMKQILEQEGTVIPLGATYEVSVKYTTSYGIDLEPNFGCRVRVEEEEEDFYSIYGYGDTIDAALSDFWRSVREEKEKKKPSVQFEEGLMNRGSLTKLPYCVTPCDLSVDGCRCRAKEGGEGC